MVCPVIIPDRSQRDLPPPVVLERDTHYTDNLSREEGLGGWLPRRPGLLEMYPRSSFAVLDRAGRNLQIEQEEAFSRCVLGWIDRIDKQDMSKTQYNCFKIRNANKKY